ncbi:MAG: hypothetical protein R3F46_13640 [bacterium]
MRNLHISLTLTLLLASLLLLAGCGRGQYGLRGLSLPAGSSVVDETRELTEIPGVQGSPDSRISTLTVRFNNPDGWESVVAHFDSQLAGLGYRETQYSAYKGSFTSEDEKRLMSAGRLYEKEGSGLVVSISSMDMAAPECHRNCGRNCSAMANSR